MLLGGGGGGENEVHAERRRMRAVERRGCASHGREGVLEQGFHVEEKQCREASAVAAPVVHRIYIYIYLSI